MTDDIIPFADDPKAPPEFRAAPTTRPAPAASASRPARRSWFRFLPIVLIVAASIGHGWAIWRGLGGSEVMANEWVPWRDDHPGHFHRGMMGRAFLSQSGTTAGYDPYFMAGYSQSVAFPPSSTLPDVWMWLFGGGGRPEIAFKWYVLLTAAVAPWLVMAACLAQGMGRTGIAAAVLLFLGYVWTDRPINLVEIGMTSCFAAAPTCLIAAGLFGRYMDAGGIGRWLAAALLCSAAFLAHPTVAMLLAPAGAPAYLGVWWSRRRRGEGLPLSRHLGVWSVPLVALALNAFWWAPIVRLAATRGSGDFGFVHPEGSLARIAKLFTSEAPVEMILIGFGLPGLIVLGTRSPGRGLALAGVAAAGWFWAYAAADIRALDFLQPGRRDHALYSALAVASGAAVSAGVARLRARSGGIGVDGVRLDRWALAAAALIGIRILGVPAINSVRSLALVEPTFLSTRPPTEFDRILDWIRKNAEKGDRMLYEEGGIEIPGVPEPFGGGRFSGLIPWKTGVELIGGPSLKADLATNFTQFGGGRLFGRDDWDADFFRIYARLYRPRFILCWSPRAVGMVSANPELFTILEREGPFVFARVVGFEGDAIRGSARVEASPGRLVVRDMIPDLDGCVVLGYHSVPSLRARPAATIDEEFAEGDPVPFIRIKPDAGTGEVTLEMALPPPFP